MICGYISTVRRKVIAKYGYGEDENVKRCVLIRDEEYQVWVKASALDEYGYELQPEERLSEAEFEALPLNCETIGTDRTRGAEPTVSFDEAYAALKEAFDEDAEPAVIEHLLVATYYAAKIDPNTDDEVVDELRALVHERTSHVDTSHPETLKKTLDETLE